TLYLLFDNFFFAFTFLLFPFRSYKKDMALTTRPKRPSLVNITKEEYKYIDQDSISEDLNCSICHDVFDTVKKTKRCKHLFCYACILQALAQNKSCLICRTHCTENDLQTATKVQIDLDQLSVY